MMCARPQPLPFDVVVAGVSLDGARLGGSGTLFVAVLLPQRQLAFWAPHRSGWVEKQGPDLGADVFAVQHDRVRAFVLE